MAKKKKKQGKEIDYSNDPNMPKLVVPMMRRVFPELIANDIVGVQPMSGPVGTAFALRYKYGGIPEGIAQSQSQNHYTIKCVNCNSRCNVTDEYFAKVIIEEYGKENFCPYCYEELKELQKEVGDRKKENTQTICLSGIMYPSSLSPMISSSVSAYWGLFGDDWPKNEFSQ